MTEEKKRKKPKYASRKQNAELYNLLEKICVPNPSDPNLIIYLDGWTDAKIAEHIGISENTVREARQEDFGNLQYKRVPADREKSSSAEQLKNLSQKIVELQSNLELLEKRFEQIEKYLTDEGVELPKPTTSFGIDI